MTADERAVKEAVCEHCGLIITEPTNEMPYWQDADKFLAWLCPSSPIERHEPIEGMR